MQYEKKVMTVSEFCETYCVGRNLFYKLLSVGMGPQIMKIGRRTLISVEAADAWGREMERLSPRQNISGGE